MNGTILIIEDEKKLAGLLRDYLEQSGFGVVCREDGVDVVPWMKENNPDLVILDRMLPGCDGLELCKEIRLFSSVPIIIATARVEEVDRLLGLELGADDYICKPFSPREVVARVKAILRRTRAGMKKPSSGLLLDEQRHLATFCGRTLELTVVEFKLLHLLTSQPGRVFDRYQLMDRIYSDRRTVCDRTIDSHIKKLRKKLSEAGADLELIHSVYGAGYKYEPC